MNNNCIRTICQGQQESISGEWVCWTELVMRSQYLQTMQLGNTVTVLEEWLEFFRSFWEERQMVVLVGCK